MDKVINVPADIIWDVFMQLMAALGIMASLIISIMVWFGKKSLSKLEHLVDKTGSHSVTIEIHGHRITAVEKRQDEFQKDQDRQDEQIYLVSYNGGKQLNG